MSNNLPVAKAPRGYFWSVVPFTMNERLGFTLQLRKRYLLVFSKNVGELMFWSDASDAEVLEGAQTLLAKV